MSVLTLLASICGSRRGSYTPITRWLLYADHEVAPICRSLTHDRGNQITLLGLESAGQVEQAIATCEKATGTNLYWWIHVPLAAAYGNNGDMEKAAAAKAKVLRSMPGYTISRFRADRYSDHPEYVKLLEKYWVAGLRRAGFPEK